MIVDGLVGEAKACTDFLGRQVPGNQRENLVLPGGQLLSKLPFRPFPHLAVPRASPFVSTQNWRLKSILALFATGNLARLAQYPIVSSQFDARGWAQVAQSRSSGDKAKVAQRLRLRLSGPAASRSVRTTIPAETLRVSHLKRQLVQSASPRGRSHAKFFTDSANRIPAC